MEVVEGSAQALHDLGVSPRRTVRIHLPVTEAVVLGSTQASSTVDGERAASMGVELARRRSGGGAVHLTPEGQLWLDVVIPAGDALWDDDVGRAGGWLGRSWCRALDRGLSPGGAYHEVWTGRPVDAEAGRLACFASTGPGEVRSSSTVGPGVKLVGVSQRRTRWSARFQSVVYLRWDPEPLLGILRAGEAGERVGQALREGAGAPGLEPGLAEAGLPSWTSAPRAVPGLGLVERFLDALPGS